MRIYEFHKYLNYVYVERNFYSDENSESTNGRFAYTFDEPTLTATLTSEFELMISKWLTIEENEKLERSRNAFEALQAEFDAYKNSYSVLNTEVDELKNFKDNRLDEEHKLDINTALSEFEDLSEIEEFVSFKETAYNIQSVDELREKCYAIRGKNATVKFAVKPNKNTTIKLPVGGQSFQNDEPYGGLFSEFNKQK